MAEIKWVFLFLFTLSQFARGLSSTCDIDLGFIIDDSGSIRDNDFRKEIDFVKSVSSKFGVGTDRTRTSLITFSGNAKLHYEFRDYAGYNSYGLNYFLSKIKRSYGGTVTDKALNLARTKMFTTGSGTRNDKPNILMVVTDGNSQSGVNAVKIAAQKLTSKGINIFAIGVGGSINNAELLAIASDSRNVFHVTSASYLNTIVNRVKETSCKTVACSYRVCQFGSWGSWSKTCGDSSRTRKLTYSSSTRTVYRVGGCAGLTSICPSVDTEYKTLSACPARTPRRCNYKDCSYYSWGRWSATCGSITRSRRLYRAYDRSKYVYSDSECDAYTKSCSNPSTETKTLTACPINCPYKDCSYYSWGSWSATCGSITRSRRLYRAYSKTAKVPATSNCNSYSNRQSCLNTDTERKTLPKCPIICKYKDCYYRSWSSWSGTCGSITRTRSFSYSYSRSRVVSAESDCDKYTKTCVSKQTDKKTLASCPITCSYKDCSYYKWASWSATCGPVTRTRRLYRAYDKKVIVSKIADCVSYSNQQSCQNYVTESKTLDKCPILCKYKECYYRSWSSWTATCGSISRSRQFSYSYSRSKHVKDETECKKYTKICSRTLREQKTLAACPIRCSYKDCSYKKWASWSATCGQVTRARQLYRAYTRTAIVPATSNCNSYSNRQTCQSVQSEQKTLSKCPIKCHYKQCYYLSWSSWSATCGQISRSKRYSYSYSRTIQVKDASECTKYPAKCQSVIEEKKTLSACPINCPYKACSYYSWGSWSATCGNMTRSRRLYRAYPRNAVVPATSNCNSYSNRQSCLRIETDNKMSKCPVRCNYKDCSYHSWGRWSATCGNITRSRRLYRAYDRTKNVNTYSDCDSYPKTCSKVTTESKVLTACPIQCPYKDCSYYRWARWSATCGNVTRNRRLYRASSKTAKVPATSNCNSYSNRQSCLNIQTQRKTLSECPITCKYKECRYESSWSSWSATCGNATRTKKLYRGYTRSKKVLKSVCDTYVKVCPSEQTEKKTFGICIPKRRCILDLGVLLDESSSIASSDFTAEKSFIKYLTNSLTIGVSHTRVSVMSYAASVRFHSRFRDYYGYSKTGLDKLLGRIRKSGGSTATEKALNDARNKMFTLDSGARDGVSKVLIIITDGQSNEGKEKVQEAAEKLKKQFVNIFAVGVGPNTKKEELQAMASSPSHVLHASSFDALSGIMNELQGSMCQENTCKYVECQYFSWSLWSGSCGTATRTRNMRIALNREKKQTGGCSGLPTTCEKVQSEEKKLVSCPSIPTKECKLDLGAILDESGSIAPAINFKKETNFIKDVTTYLTIGPSNTRVSVITFSTNARLRFKFNEYEGYSRVGLQNALNGLTMRGGNTATDKALDLARTEMFTAKSGQRDGVSKVLLVITDGNSQAGSSKVGKASDLLSARGVNVFAIGVGRVNYNELKAIATNDKNIFQVGSLAQLTSAVNSVRRASCQSVTCRYKQCEYHQWTSWTATCGKSASRNRKFKSSTNKVEERLGGCAGLTTTCESVQYENKQLLDCSTYMVSCKNYVCTWSSWTQYSTTCGKNTTRSRYLIEDLQMRNYTGSCPNNLNTQPCSKTPQTERRSFKCPCRVENCDWHDWSTWSATCGDVNRSRNLRRFKDFIYEYDCVEAQKKFGCQETENNETQSAKKSPCKQRCQYAECTYNPWSSWSGSCGKNTRARDVNITMETKLMVSCEGLKKNCSGFKRQTQNRIKTCTCPYVECEPDTWSPWSTKCGKGSRQRNINQVSKTEERLDCLGLLQKCPKFVENEERDTLCQCNFVECQAQDWSSWSATCGKANRSRTIKTVKKTAKKVSCNGLKQQCPSEPENESRELLCSCSVAECNWDAWSKWSASCGNVTRQRSIKLNMTTIQRLSCDGLAQTCTQKPQVEDKKIKCSCEYTRCEWIAWSTWSATCGVSTRSRDLQSTKATVKAYSCEDVTEKHSCKIMKTSEQENVTREPCTQECNYVECSYNQWSAWSASCGEDMTRTRTVKTTFKSTRLPSCSGLTMNCSSLKDQSQQLAKKCLCDYVECVAGSWSSWSAQCGNASRKRDIKTIQNTTQQFKCKGLQQSCPKDVENEDRFTLCTCDYVECVPAAWSSWSATCGKLTRSRDINTVKKTTLSKTCNGLQTTCPKSKEGEEKETLCTCSVAECSWNEWSTWSATCGDISRVRTMSTDIKSVRKLSCDGLKTECTQKPENEAKKTPCPLPPTMASPPCKYVDCVPGQWSTWTSDCGKASRSRDIATVRKTIRKDSCVGLKITCDESVEEQTRNKLCTCEYVECVPGQWSDWSSKCGRGKRSRPINVVKKSVQLYSCDGLNVDCIKEEDVEERNELCECDTVECIPAEWSKWSSECGQGRRSRAINAVQKLVKKSSCDGVQTVCPENEESEDRNKKCTCNYVECEPGTWSDWSKDCGKIERSRPVNAVVKTIEKYSCNGLQQTCAKTEEVEDKTTKCTCNYVECKPAQWSDWSAQCGKGLKRTRQIEVMQKTVKQESCDGLKTKCDQTEETETKDELCTCDYVKCEWSAWSTPSASCGLVSTTRSIREVAMSVKQYSCDGLKQECVDNEEVVYNKVKCKCHEAECVPGKWSEWSADCGAATRTRSINTVLKTIEKVSCDGLQQTCPKPEESEMRNTLCECDTVECLPAEWSKWSSDCGQGQRTRAINAVQKVVKKSSCDGVQTTCPKNEESEDRNKKCTCNYVECEPGTWSDWSKDCGKAERSRLINVVVKTVKRYSCDGLQQTCAKTEEVEDRTTKCTCSYVECEPGQWSDWSAKCGNIKRTRTINVIEKSVQSESCDGLQTACPKTEEVETKSEMCTCSYVECNWSPWSRWSATCGEVTRERQIIGRLARVQKLSCDGLKMICMEKPQTETRNTKCPPTDNEKQGAESCHIKFRPLGCYQDDQKNPRPLPELILTERDSTHRSWNGRLIQWKNWNSYHMEFICRCAAKAKELKYRFFGTQFYGECWSGPEAGDTYFQNGEAKHSTHCVKSDYKGCEPGDSYCVGRQYTNYVYKLD